MRYCLFKNSFCVRIYYINQEGSKVIKEISQLTFFPAVSLVLTNACRMRCKFCCAKTELQTQSMDQNNIPNILKILHGEGVRRICFSGGEPLLYPQIKDILETSYNYGIENTIMTSDGELLCALDIPIEHLSKVWLSIHGYQDTHDDITGVKGSFEKLKVAMKIKSDYPLGVWCVLTKSNSKDIEKLIELCIENNIKNFYISNVSTVGWGDEYIQNNGIYSVDEFNFIVNKIKNKYDKKITIKYQSFEDNAQCIIVESNGDVIISPHFESENNQKLIGNITKENPKDIFAKFKSDEKVWRGYQERQKRSSLYNNKIER